MSKFILTATLVGLWAGMGLFTSTCPAADDFGDPEVRSNDVDDDWYYHDESTQTRPSPQAIIQQKAQVRAQHRQSRIEAMNWYGMSNSRPTVSTTPFCSMYSPTWQTPGGRPYAWYASTRPIYLIYTR